MFRNIDRFRKHLASAQAILNAHADTALAEAQGDLRRAAVILADKASRDEAFGLHVDALNDLSAATNPSDTLGRTRKAKKKDGRT